MTKKTFIENESDRIHDEIRKRVLAKYADLQGIKNQEDELQATLDALHEMTRLPKNEISKIASEVQSKYMANSKTPTIEIDKTITPEESSDLMFEQWNRKVESSKRGFIYHLIPYLIVNTVLIYLNIYSTSFPWAMFPLLGWGVGLTSHFMASVYWPQKDLKKKVGVLRSQIQKILIENWPGFNPEQQPDISNAVYRLIIMEAPESTLKQYLKHTNELLEDSVIGRMSTQFAALQARHLTQ